MPGAFVLSMKKCDGCGYTSINGHPIPHCYKCEREAYDARFAELRGEIAQTHLLGYDPYGDTIYVWANGVVAAIEGRADRMLRLQKADEMVRRITDLEAENKDLLAENARLRRRLDTPRAIPNKKGA